MNPIFNTLMAIYQVAGLLTPEAAEKMALKMQGSIHQSSYRDAVRMVQEVEKEVDNFTAEPWVARIASLEKRVETLEKQVLTNKKK